MYMPSLSSKPISEERLTCTVVVGNTHELKLVGVPAYQPGTHRHAGDIQAYLTVDLLSLRKCGGSVVNMTFDTTESNTGHVTAARVTIQERLSRALLWSACHHHIVEVILSHVFDDMKIIATSKSPEVTVFARFRKHFQLLGSPRSASLITPLSALGKLNSIQTFWHRQMEKDIIRMFCKLLRKTAAEHPVFVSEKMTFCCYMAVVNTMRLHGKTSKRRR